MAGFGGDLSFDEKALQSLPVGRDAESRAERRALFQKTDINGNGILSLAECDSLIVNILRIRGVQTMKPVINRAFHAARDIVPAVGSIGPHYVDFHEFRYFLIYLQHYLDMFLMFCRLDGKDHTGKFSDRRLTFKEFEQAIPKLLEWGLEDDVVEQLHKNPRAVFRDLDVDGGGVVLFDEFAHWALWNHIFQLDGDHDGDAEEALSVLRKQRPNLCAKDLAGIQACKARFRVGAKMHGQGCLGGDPSLEGGYERIVDDGAKELVAGRHWPGGAASWKASFHGKSEDAPGKYRACTHNMAIYSGPKKASGKISTMPNGTEFEVLEVIEIPEENRIRARIQAGYVALKNTDNGFRWAVRLREKGSKRTAWKDSYERCEEADEDFVANGVPQCVNGCGQPRFGRYLTCCTHCTGPTGPHAHDCVTKGYAECENGCGHPQFGMYKTCCTHCKGSAGPHARGCLSKEEKRRSVIEARRSVTGGDKVSGYPEAQGGKGAPALCQPCSIDIASASTLCSNGCSREAFKRFPTCCTHCKGVDGPHASDCDKRTSQANARTNTAKTQDVFARAKDLPAGMSRKRFTGLLRTVFTQEDLCSAFSACDKDGDGIIRSEDFLEWVWSEGVTQERRNDIIDCFDI